MKRYLIGMTVIFALTASPPSLAQTGPDPEQRMEEVTSRLGLSDEQVEQLAPVLEKSRAAQQEILSKYGIDLESGSGPSQKLGMRNGRAMRQELDVVRSDMLAEVEGILTNEQFEAFKQIQEERRAEMRERVRSRR